MNANIPVMPTVKQGSPFNKKGNGNKSAFVPPAPSQPHKEGFYQLLIPIMVEDSIKWFMAEQYFSGKGHMVEFEPSDDELKGFIYFQPSGLPIQFIDEKHRLYEKRLADVKEAHALLNGDGSTPKRVRVEYRDRLVHELTRRQKLIGIGMFFLNLILIFHTLQVGL